MHKTIKIITAGMLLASTAIAPAFAQGATTTPATPNATTGGTTNSMDAAPAAPSATPAKPMTNDSASATMPGSGAGEYLTQQTAEQLSANDFIGQSVYNEANDSIGSINDLIFDKQGGVVAAVVGVGGFLGIGEKNVAVPMDRITAAQDPQNSEMRLTTMETADSLNAAPAFQTLDQQASNSNATTGTTTGTDATTTSSTVTK